MTTFAHPPIAWCDDESRRSASAGAPSARFGLWYTRVFLFACFFPYPGLPIGNRNGLQFCQAMAFASTLAFLYRPPARALYVLVLMMTAMLVSDFINVIRYMPPQPDVMVKEALSYLIALFPLLMTTAFRVPGRFRDALIAAALATFAHAAVGAYQLYAFSKNVFPLLWIYRNPSFMPMESWAEAYATYMKRPCGLFPEPSAMGAALGPWLVVAACQGLIPTPGLGLTRRARRLLLGATVAGFLLLGLSRSGSTAGFVLALLFVIGAKARPLLNAYGAAGIGAALLLVVVALGSGAYFVATEGAELDRRIDSSWGLRGRSIYEAFTANIATSHAFTGLGAGQAEPVIQRLMADVALPQGDEKVAVWSLVGAFYMEHGLLGAAAMLAVLAMMVRAVARSSERALGWASLMAWVLGPTVTTSYMHIIPVWLFLGALLEWDRIFPRVAPTRGGVA